MLFVFTQSCISQAEKGQPREFYVDPQKFHYAMLTFDVPQEERREALGLLTWLAHELSTPEPDTEPDPHEGED